MNLFSVVKVISYNVSVHVRGTHDVLFLQENVIRDEQKISPIW